MPRKGQIERHPVTGIRRRVLELGVTRWEHECAECGEWFEPARTDAIYCSKRCKVRAHRSK